MQDFPNASNFLYTDADVIFWPDVSVETYLAQLRKVGLPDHPVVVTNEHEMTWLSAECQNQGMRNAINTGAVLIQINPKNRQRKELQDQAMTPTLTLTATLT